MPTSADMTNDVAARFDRAAGQWDSNPGRIALAKAVAGAIRKAIPLHSGMQMLDFGAGTGLLTLALQPYVGAITAVDTSTQMLRAMEEKLAALRIVNVKTVHADIARAPLPVAAFDVVVSSMVLHHIRDVLAALARLRPCVRPGGWIAVADLDAEDGSFHSDATGVYHRGFERPTVGAWLEQAGFAGAKTCDAHRIDRDGRQYGVFLATARG